MKYEDTREKRVKWHLGAEKMGFRKRELQNREELLMTERTSTNEDVTLHSNFTLLPLI